MDGSSGRSVENHRTESETTSEPDPLLRAVAAVACLLGRRIWEHGSHSANSVGHELQCVGIYIIYIIYIIYDLYFGPPTTQNKVFSYQNRGQVGSRYIYILYYIRTVIRILYTYQDHPVWVSWRSTTLPYLLTTGLLLQGTRVQEVLQVPVGTCMFLGPVSLIQRSIEVLLRQSPRLPFDHSKNGNDLVFVVSNP